MEKLNLDKKTLKKFGITMGIAFLVIAVIFLSGISKLITCFIFAIVCIFYFCFYVPAHY